MYSQSKDSIMCKHCVLYYGPIWCSGVPIMYRRGVLNATFSEVRCVFAQSVTVGTCAGI